MISRDRSDNITTLLRWTSDASSAFRSMGLVPIIPEPRRDVIIGLGADQFRISRFIWTCRFLPIATQPGDTKERAQGAFRCRATWRPVRHHDAPYPSETCMVVVR